METKTVTGPGGCGQLWVRLKRRGPVDEGPTAKAAKKATKSGGEEDHA